MYLEDNTPGQNWKVIRRTGLREKFNKSNNLEGSILMTTVTSTPVAIVSIYSSNNCIKPSRQI